MICRFNRQRAWAARIILEWMVSEACVFVTLTYSDEELPLVDGEMTLYPRDCQLFLKRFRKVTPFRYFLVGEYGDRTQRPHYHLAFFNVGTEYEEAIDTTWGKGFTSVSDMTNGRAMYLAHYCTKKMTSPDDPRIGLRTPEFARMSRRPALGTPGLEYLSSLHHTKEGSQAMVDNNNDIMTEFRTGGRRWPLDYTMRQKLRALLGVPQRASDRNQPPLVKPTSEELSLAGRQATRMEHRVGKTRQI